MSKGIVALEWMVSKLPKDGYAAEDIQTIRRVRDLLDSLVGDPPAPPVPARKSSRLSLGELHKLAAEAMVGPSSAADTTTTDKGIAHKLHVTSLADLLEAVGVNVAILAQVDKPSKILKLLGGTDMLQTMARYVFEAVRPHAQLGGEEKVEEEAEEEGGEGSLAVATTRSKFRQTLEEVIGPQVAGRDWRTEEWVAVVTERALGLGYDSFEAYAKKMPRFASAQAYHEFVVQQGNHQMVLSAGFSAEQAELVDLLAFSAVPVAMGRAIAERSDRFASMTHALYNALAAKASEGNVAPKCYGYLTGTGVKKGRGFGLADKDPRWLHITEPDATGFKGMTTHGPLRMVKAHENQYSPEGVRNLINSEYHTMESTVVCLESAPPEDRGRVLHSAVDVGGNGYVLPPLTLLEVVSVQGPGEWEYLPGKRINQKLITVRPTYLLPARRQLGSNGASKFASDRTFLEYGNTQDAVRGIEEITDRPVLTMDQEWARDDQWSDWKGSVYSGWREWLYVINAVGAGEQRQEGGGVGGRDVGRDGFSLQDFMDQINGYVKEKATKMKLETPPLLTRLEVIAIRLYTGPGYVPLNMFLREVAKVGPEWRQKLSHMPGLSYASTVLHLTNGLRKLVRVNDEAKTIVYRGIRGELPEAFWLTDAFGMVTATDFAFMSTSVDEDVCVRFMSTEEKNVLWEIRCSEETSDGFHCGADVSLLSQFPTEKEMLFPPLTMLQVQRQPGRKRTQFVPEDVTAKKENGDEVTYTRIVVKPSFV